jgi:hypothetical protein
MCSACAESTSLYKSNLKSEHLIAGTAKRDKPKMRKKSNRNFAERKMSLVPGYYFADFLLKKKLFHSDAGCITAKVCITRQRGRAQCIAVRDF